MFKHADFFMMKYEWYRSIPTKEVKVGSKFGKWTVISNVRYKNPDWDYDPDALWECVCECGRKRRLSSMRLNTIEINKVEHGWNDGCGKCDKEMKAPMEEMIKRREERRRLFTVWSNMRQRCNNSNHTMYKHYGGRGIKICDEWNSNFQSFFEYVTMLEHYGEPKRSIDRIDNNDDYKPGNVRWATHKEQCNNRRKRNGLK